MAASLEISLSGQEMYIMIPTPEEAWALLCEYNQGEFHRKRGLIGAAALMRPSRSVSDMEVKSVKKKYKDKKFAAGCSREVIERGAAMLGWDLDTLIEQTIQAMRASSAVE